MSLSGETELLTGTDLVTGRVPDGAPTWTTGGFSPQVPQEKIDVLSLPFCNPLLYVSGTCYKTLLVGLEH